MNFKLLGAALLSATVLLTACGQNNDKAMKDENKKSETKSDKNLMIQRKINKVRRIRRKNIKCNLKKKH